MNKDLSVSSFNPEFAFENMNLRLSTNDGNTTLSWVNEKGPAKMSIRINWKSWNAPYWTGDNTSSVNHIDGIPIGTAVINHKLILFTTDHSMQMEVDPRRLTPRNPRPDYIYLLEYSSEEEGGVITHKMTGCILYRGYLNFNPEYPLETMVSYEAEHIQKVYWTDGLNQPRIINIDTETDFNKANLETWNSSKYNSSASPRVMGTPLDMFFDFVPSITQSVFYSTDLPDVIAEFKVTKNSSSGVFAPGVIQYCFTYLNKYRQQTNVVGISSLQYLAFNDRAASPEEKVGNSFTLTISNANYYFEYVRIYSIQRTSLNAEPIAKVLGDIPITTHQEDNDKVADTLEFTDNGTIGYSIDPKELLYVGGKDITVLTMTEKDGTLFMGNIEQKNTLVNDIQEYFDTDRDAHAGHLVNNGTVGFVADKQMYMNHTTGIYSHTNTLNKNLDKITTFKGGETYRFGFQLQKTTGEWTEPIYLEDKKNWLYPDAKVFSDTVQLVTANAAIDFSAISEVPVSQWSQYIRVRPVIVYPSFTDRNVVCQGVLNPTMFNS